MIIERFLNHIQLKRYRAWKQNVRASINLWVRSIVLAVRNGGFRRLLDTDYSPIFICGVSGSGTTLIGGLLDQDYESEMCIHVSDRLQDTDRSLWMKHSSSYEDLDEYYRDLTRTNRYSSNKVRRAVLGLYRRLSVYPRRSNIVLDKAPNSHMVRIGILRKALPKSKIILIYRRPAEVIEGLRRKWKKPFGLASLEDLCLFWNKLHEIFLDNCRSFSNDLFVLSYEQLTDNPKFWIETVAAWANLKKRSTTLKYEDLSNEPGKGLRNIVGGRINVIKDAFREVQAVLPEEELELIQAQTSSTWNKLEEMKKEL